MKKIIPDENCNMIILVWPFMYEQKPYWNQIINTFKEMILILLENKNHVLIVTNNPKEINDKANEIYKENRLVDLKNNLHTFTYECNDIWIRDYGPIQVQNNVSNEYNLYGYNFNGYGNKYVHEKDKSFADYFSKYFIKYSKDINYNLFEKPFDDLIIEGGNVQSNKNGLIIFNRKCLLKNNKGNWNSIKQYFDDAVKKYYINDYLFFDLDPITGDDTNGHLDNLIRIYNENLVFYMSSNDIEHPDFYLLQELKQQLEALQNKTSNIKQIIPINHTTDDIVLNQQSMMLPFSYLNFIITNNVIIFPANKNTKIESLDKILPFFNNKRNYLINVEGLLNELGGLHCCSLNISY